MLRTCSERKITMDRRVNKLVNENLKPAYKTPIIANSNILTRKKTRKRVRD